MGPRLVGATSLICFALVAYFLLFARSDDSSYDAARVLRINAGACAIAGVAFGLLYLNLRDEETLRRKRAEKASEDA